MRSARRATPGSWVTTSSVSPRAFSRSSRSSTCAPEARVEVAGRLVGEQHARAASRSRGRSPTRWRSPPESSLGPVVGAVARGRPPRAPRATRSAALGARDAGEDHRQLDVAQPRRAAARGGRTGRRSRSSLLAQPARARRRRARRPRARRGGRSREVGRSRQPMMFSSVDLPEPDGPMIATCSPAAIVSLDVDQRVHRLVADLVGARDVLELGSRRRVRGARPPTARAPASTSARRARRRPARPPRARRRPRSKSQLRRPDLDRALDELVVLEHQHASRLRAAPRSGCAARPRASRGSPRRRPRCRAAGSRRGRRRRARPRSRPCGSAPRCRARRARRARRGRGRSRPGCESTVTRTGCPARIAAESTSSIGALT